mgnify:FL=1
MKKYVDGNLVDCTEEEITQFNADKTQFNNGALDRAFENLRFKRNNLLVETDWMANSDVTMSSEMTTYRQELRDITNGLTTVAQVEAVEFPTKPSGE